MGYEQIKEALNVVSKKERAEPILIMIKAYERKYWEARTRRMVPRATNIKCDDCVADWLMKRGV